MFTSTAYQWCGGFRPHGYDLDRATGFLHPIEAEAAVVQRIFRLYTRDRIGTRAIAGLLNDAGHRTKTGKPWSGAAVLTVLRNRVYLGEVFYRNRWHRADPHHPALIGEGEFAEAEQVLIARGDDHVHRAGARSDYPLAGLIFCAHCGKRYLGTAAKGNRYRYRYYTCFSRHRYGTDTCAGERLPAEQVEQGVLESMLDTLARTDLIDAAFGDAYDESLAQRAAHQTELAGVEAEIAKTAAAIDRYLSAFESNTMPEATCAPRVEALSRKAVELRRRRDELGLLINDTSATGRPTAEHLTALRDRIRHDIDTAVPDTVQALLQAMTVKIEVTSRASITPTFRIPTKRSGAISDADTAGASEDTKVRTLPESVPPAGLPKDGTGSDLRISTGLLVVEAGFALPVR